MKLLRKRLARHAGDHPKPRVYLKLGQLLRTVPRIYGVSQGFSVCHGRPRASTNDKPNTTC